MTEVNLLHRKMSSSLSPSLSRTLSYLRPAHSPDCGQPCSTVMRWCVFAMERAMVSKSSGRRVRRLITSHSIPETRTTLNISNYSNTKVLINNYKLLTAAAQVWSNTLKRFQMNMTAVYRTVTRGLRSDII